MNECNRINQYTYQIYNNGDSAYTVIFDATISEQLSHYIHSLASLLSQKMATTLTEVIPAYQSLTVCFNPLEVSGHNIKQKLHQQLMQNISPAISTGNIVKIPVCYQPPYAIDLKKVCKTCNLPPEEIIRLHTQPRYLVHMLGFSPGFLYLGGLNKRLYCERKQMPDMAVPAGSVGIGGMQTGVYPQQTPGGWQIIGCTPLSLFQPNTSSPYIASPLDYVQFISISVKTFSQIKQTIT